MLRRLAIITAAIALLGCQTTDGPRIALPAQHLEAPVPEGFARVIVLNTSIEALNYAFGTMRIQIDGKQVPSLYLNHYVQLFLKPGRHELVLGRLDFFGITFRYELDIKDPALIAVYAVPGSLRYRALDSLPGNFHEKFIGGRDRSEWPTFDPESTE